MGIWTTLYRFDARAYEAHLERPDADETFWRACHAGARAPVAATARRHGRRGLARAELPDPRPVAEVATGRTWHALHVALTGLEEGGGPPASYVVYDGAHRFDWQETGFVRAFVANGPDEVRRVADHLSRVAYGVLEADLLAYVNDHALYVYSFGGRGGENVVTSGRLRETFEAVAAFYRAAAAAGDAVIAKRG